MLTRTPRTPAYRHHKPSGQAVVTLDGRDLYLGRFNSPESRAEFDRLVAEWLANGRRLPPVNGAGSDLTINELGERFLLWADSYYRKGGEPTGEADTIRLALRPLRHLYGHTAVSGFGPLALKTVRQTMIDSKLCRNECNRRTSIVVRMFRWAVENELAPPSAHHALRSVKGLAKGRSEARESEPVRPVPEAFVAAVEPHTSRQVWAMIRLQSLSGMRPGEVMALRSCDLDTSGRVWTYRPADHKTAHHGRDRVIYFGPQAQAVLREWLRPDLAGLLFQPREAEIERRAEQRAGRKTPVQPSQRNRRKRSPRMEPGDRYTTHSYRRAIERACKLAKVPDWSPNRLRHNAATRLRREFGLDVARAVLGHSSPAVTEVYAEIDGAKAAEAMERVG